MVVNNNYKVDHIWIYIGMDYSFTNLVKSFLSTVYI